MKPPGRPWWSPLRWARALFTGLLALVLVFEEWGWEPLARLMAWIARLPVLRVLERRIATLPPWAALATFALPALALLPIKLLALFLFGRGHAGWGLTLLLGAKLAGTAVLARLFQLTQPALMRLAWFARWYPRWVAWKEALLAQLRASPAWRWGRAVKARARRWAHRLWRSVRGAPADPSGH